MDAPPEELIKNSSLSSSLDERLNDSTPYSESKIPDYAHFQNSNYSLLETVCEVKGPL
jgi:hypothetical protein